MIILLARFIAILPRHVAHLLSDLCRRISQMIGRAAFALILLLWMTFICA